MSGTVAFECFYERTAGSIRAYILRHCSDRGSADDLFQTTYIKFLNSPMARRPNAREAKAYLYRIASNVIADHGRMLQRQERLEASMPRPSTTDSRMFNPENIELRQALRGLSKRDQQLLWLLYGEGFAHKEVAHIMKISRASVRVLAFRARKKLEQRLAAVDQSHTEVYS